MDALGAVPNGDSSVPNEDVSVPNGDSLQCNGLESFAVIDKEPESYQPGGSELQVGDSLELNSLWSVNPDDLVVQVRQLLTEDKKLQELMDTSNQTMAGLTGRITQRLQLLNDQIAALKQENGRLNSVFEVQRRQVEHLEKELTFTQQTCDELRSEIELNRAVEEESEEMCRIEIEGLTAINERLKTQMQNMNGSNEETETLKAEIERLKSVRDSTEHLLVDMEKLQVLKSDAEKQVADLKKDVQRLNEELAKVKRINEKIIVEKQDLVKINTNLESELAEERLKLGRLEDLPISLISANFPKLREEVVFERSSAEPDLERTSVETKVEENRTEVKQRTSNPTENAAEEMDEESDEENSEAYRTGDEDVADCDDETRNALEEGAAVRLTIPLTAVYTSHPSQKSEHSPHLSKTEVRNPGLNLSAVDSFKFPQSVDPNSLQLEGHLGDIMSSIKSSTSGEPVTSMSSIEASMRAASHASISTELHSIRDEVERLLSTESSLTMAPGRRELLQKIDYLLAEISIREERCLELELGLNDQKREIECYKEAAKEIEERLTSMTTNHDNLKQQVDKYQVNMMTIQSENVKLMRRVNYLESNQSNVVSMVESERRQSASSESGESKSQIQQLEKRCADLEEKCADLQKNNVHFKDSAASTAELNNWVVDVEEKHKQEMTNLLKQMNDVKRELQLEQKETLHSDKVIIELRERIEDLTQENQMTIDDLECIKSDRDRIQRELLEHRNQTDALCNDYHRRASSVEDLAQQLALKEVECDELRKDIRNLHIENERLNAELNQATEDRDFHSAQAKIFENDFKEERASRQELKSLHDNLTAQVQRLQRELMDLNDRANRRSPGHQHGSPGAPYPAGGQPYNNYRGGDFPWRQYMPGHVVEPPEPRPRDQQAVLECPKCYEHFPDIDKLQAHVYRCVE